MTTFETDAEKQQREADERRSREEANKIARDEAAKRERAITDAEKRQKGK